MTPEPEPGPSGLVHELMLTGAEDDVVAAVTPFVLDALAVGDRVVLCLSPQPGDILRDLFETTSGVTFLPYDPERRRANADLMMFRRIAEDSRAAGTRVRAVNEIPPALYLDWYQWRRYEAAVNVVLADFDIWGVCVYDRHALSAEMEHDLHATHPVTGQGLRCEVNRRYQDPLGFARTHFDAPPDPVERTAPAVDLADPSPAAARAAVRAFAGHHAGLADEDVEGLVFAVNEVVTNALVHGCPPVRMRLWAAPNRIVATVTDSGLGPADPFVGMVPSPSGFGMWFSQQLVDVVHRRSGGGYTVRLSAARNGYGSLGPQRAPEEGR